MKIERLEKLVAELRQRASQAVKDTNVSAVVGYTQAYALRVHEDMEAKHKPGKKAKYLEGPMRQEQDTLATIVRNALHIGRTMAQALMLAALYLQRASQKIVPVDTGALKGSAFTRLDTHD